MQSECDTLLENKRPQRHVWLGSLSQAAFAAMAPLYPVVVEATRPCFDPKKSRDQETYGGNDFDTKTTNTPDCICLFGAGAASGCSPTPPSQGNVKAARGNDDKGNCC